METRTKLAIHLILSLIMTSVFADEALLKIDNSNAKIHSMNIKAEMIKSEIALENLKDSRDVAINEKKINSYIANNNYKIKEFESAFNFMLHDTVFKIKNGEMSSDDITNDFLQRKVIAILTAEKSETEVLIAQIDKLKETISNNKDYIRDLNRQIFDLKIKEEEDKRVLVEDLNLAKLNLSRALSKILSLESCSANPESCNEEVVDEKMSLTIHSVEILSTMIFKELKKITLSVNYSISSTINEIMTLDNIIILNSKNIIVPNFGTINIAISDKNIITFSHKGLLLFSQPVL